MASMLAWLTRLVWSRDAFHLGGMQEPSSTLPQGDFIPCNELELQERVGELDCASVPVAVPASRDERGGTMEYECGLASWTVHQLQCRLQCRYRERSVEGPWSTSVAWRCWGISAVLRILVVNELGKGGGLDLLLEASSLRPRLPCGNARLLKLIRSNRDITSVAVRRAMLGNETVEIGGHGSHESRSWWCE